MANPGHFVNGGQALISHWKRCEKRIRSFKWAAMIDEDVRQNEGIQAISEITDRTIATISKTVERFDAWIGRHPFLNALLVGAVSMTIAFAVFVVALFFWT